MSPVTPPPAHGMKHIHKAIIHELSSAEVSAAALAADNGGDVDAVRQSIQWVEKVIHVHAAGEEDIFYPALDKFESGVSTSYRLDHRVEEEIFSEIRGLIARCSAGDDDDACRRLWRQTVAANAILSLHVKKEEEHLLPLMDKYISPPEQGMLAGKMMQHIPPDEMEAMIEWMAPILSPDEREIQWRQILPGLPPEALPAFKGWYQSALTAAEWDDIVARIPELAD